MKYELYQIKTYPLDPLKRPPRGPSSLQNPIYPLDPLDPPPEKNFEILGGLLDPPEKKVRDVYELNISNEVLNIHFAQGAAKIREVKAGVKEKSVVF